MATAHDRQGEVHWTSRETDWSLAFESVFSRPSANPTVALTRPPSQLRAYFRTQILRSRSPWGFPWLRYAETPPFCVSQIFTSPEDVAMGNAWRRSIRPL